MSIERCTQCENSFDLDFQGGYIKEMPYCEGCVFDCDCGKMIPTNETCTCDETERAIAELLNVNKELQAKRPALMKSLEMLNTMEPPNPFNTTGERNESIFCL